MGDALDKASSIWSNLLTQKQLQSLGIKDEEEAKPNKRPKTEGAQRLHLGFFGQHQGNGPGDGQDSSTTRGQPSCPITGIRVCTLDSTGGGQSASNLVSPSCGMAEERQEHESQALNGSCA